jgi:hypothetical protein
VDQQLHTTSIVVQGYSLQRTSQSLRHMMSMPQIDHLSINIKMYVGSSLDSQKMHLKRIRTTLCSMMLPPVHPQPELSTEIY